MSHRTPGRVVPSTLLIVAAVTLGAHDTWLLANRGFVPVCAMVTVLMSSGGNFPANETAIVLRRWPVNAVIH